MLEAFTKILGIILIGTVTISKYRVKSGNFGH